MQVIVRLATNLSKQQKNPLVIIFIMFANSMQLDQLKSMRAKIQFRSTQINAS